MPLVRGGSAKPVVPSARSTKPKPIGSSGTKPTGPAPVSKPTPVAIVDGPSSEEPRPPSPVAKPKETETVSSTKDHDDAPRRRLDQHAAMLDSMDRKARELCDDTRRQYELLLARAEAQHERQLQSLQHKLQDVVQSSIPLSEHRQIVRDAARAHERDTQSLVKAHDDEAAALRRRFKEIANEQLLRQSRAFQHERDELLETMTQLEMDRSAALQHWREQELAQLSTEKDLEDAQRVHARTQRKLDSACQHLVALKTQLTKLDRVGAKRKTERAEHAAAQTEWREQLTAATERAHALEQRASVLETERNHARALADTRQEELTALQHAATAREAQVSELQCALAESSAKEAMLREFREREREAHEQQRVEWGDAQLATERHDAEARQQVAVVQQEKQALEAQCQRLTQELAQAARDHAQREAALGETLARVRRKYAALKQRVAALEGANAELQHDDRVSNLLFSKRSM